jgi:hypothetical protein
VTFLQFNMKLNETVSAWLEDGGDPARCADALRMIADEVFEASPRAPDEDREADAMRAQHEAWVKDPARGWR